MHAEYNKPYVINVKNVDNYWTSYIFRVITIMHIIQAIELIFGFIKYTKWDIYDHTVLYVENTKSPKMKYVFLFCNGHLKWDSSGHDPQNENSVSWKTHSIKIEIYISICNIPSLLNFYHFVFYSHSIHSVLLFLMTRKRANNKYEI